MATLTKGRIDRLKHDPNGPATQIEYDDEIPGFGVRLYESGRKAFVVWYRTASGRKRMQTIGAFGPWTLQQAREEAREIIVEANRGSDPMAERQGARRGTSVREFSAVYLERHAKPRKKTWTEDERRIEKHINPALGARKMEDLRRADVARFHGEIGMDAPYEANRVLALLRVMLNKAEEWGYLEEGTPNPAAKVEPFREKKRDRWVRPEELPRLMEAVAEEENPYIRAAVKLYLLTGLRKSELLGLRWQDVELSGDRPELRLRDTKAGRPHTVPLSPVAVEILRDLPRMLHNPHVFPGHRKGQPLVNISKPWRAIRERAGMKDVRLHDLRRTVGSWLATSGASLPLIGSVLNHTNASTTQIYAHLADDAARQALEKHGERIGPLLREAGGGEG